MLVRLPLSTCHQPDTRGLSAFRFILHRDARQDSQGNALSHHLGFQKHEKEDLDLDLQDAVAPCVSALLTENTGY